MPEKVTFDGDQKHIHVNSGVTFLDVQQDIYSAWKRWVRTGDNAKYEQAMTSVGGEPTVGGNVVPRFYFLINDWRIQPYGYTEVYTLEVQYNLFTDTGDDPFINSDVGIMPRVIMRVSEVPIIENVPIGSLSASDIALLQTAVEQATRAALNTDNLVSD